MNPDRALPWACVAAATGWLAAMALRLPAGDGDLLWQRWLGERILRDHALPRALGTETLTAAGAPWTPHEWLFSTALALATDRGSVWLVGLLCALAAGVALGAVVMRCRRRGLTAPLSSVAVLISALAMLQSFGVRAQVLGWAGLACVLWLFELEGPWIWAAVPLTAAWANLHASALLSPAIAALIAVAAALRDRSWSADVRRRTAVAAACGAATMATPLGADLPRYAVALVLSPIRHSISEWGATSIASIAFEFGALAAAAGARGLRGARLAARSDGRRCVRRAPVHRSSERAGLRAGGRPDCLGGPRRCNVLRASRRRARQRAWRGRPSARDRLRVRAFGVGVA